MPLRRKKAHFAPFISFTDRRSWCQPVARSCLFWPIIKGRGVSLLETDQTNSQIHQGCNSTWMERVGQPMRHFRSQRILLRTAVFLLLFGVAGFSTLAKQGNYLPKSNPLSNYSKSAKMELLHHPVDFLCMAAQLVSGIVPPQPDFSTTLLVKPGLSSSFNGLTIALHLRAPPSWFA